MSAHDSARSSCKALLCIRVLLIPAGDLRSAARGLWRAGQELPTLKAPRALSTMMFGTCLAMMCTAIDITMCPRPLQIVLWSRLGRLQVCLLHGFAHITCPVFPHYRLPNLVSGCLLVLLGNPANFYRTDEMACSIALSSPACICVSCASLRVPS